MTNEELQMLLMQRDRRAQITVELPDGQEIAIVGLDYRSWVTRDETPRLCLLVRSVPRGWRDPD